MALVAHVVLAASAQPRFRLTALERGVLAPIEALVSGGDCQSASRRMATAVPRRECKRERRRARAGEEGRSDDERSACSQCPG